MEANKTCTESKSWVSSKPIRIKRVLCWTWCGSSTSCVVHLSFLYVTLLKSKLQHLVIILRKSTSKKWIAPNLPHSARNHSAYNKNAELELWEQEFQCQLDEQSDVNGTFLVGHQKSWCTWWVCILMPQIIYVSQKGFQKAFNSEPKKVSF